MVDSVSWEHRPLLSGHASVSAVRFSPDGKRLLFAATSRGKTQLFVRWLDSGQTALLTNVNETPKDAVWSPDGTQIALVMRVPTQSAPLIKMPPKPKGADWAPDAKVIEQMTYRVDGGGYIEEGYTHVFVVPAVGGTPRQLTNGNFNHGHPSWSKDGRVVFVDGNRNDDAVFQPLNSEIFAVNVADATVQQLTDRVGPDYGPAVSPDGSRVAYLGFDDQKQGYQITELFVMKPDGTDKRHVSGSLDRDVDRFYWSKDSRRLLIQYDDRGNTKIGALSLDGQVEELTGDVGGTTLGRPYGSGSFTLANNGRIAFTHGRPEHPAPPDSR
ncbi:MAG: DPP IV N-terminal domain-containing protein, partial [Myxococcota bacterium]